MSQNVVQKPLATVITLSYNSPDLYRCIDSVLNQSYERVEYIIIDDFSANFSENEVREYISRHPNNHLEKLYIVRNENNFGTTYSSNLALRLSTGDYIFNVAGDDAFADAEVLRDWVKEFQKTGALVMTAFRDIYDEKLDRFLMRRPEKRQVKAIQKDSPQQLFEKLSVENFIFGCCTARSKECVKRFGFYNEDYRIIEDHVMNLYLLRQGLKIYFFDRVVVKYRSGGVSAALNFNSEYEKESERIIKNESLPYCRKPKRIWSRYKKWKKKQLEEKRFQYTLKMLEQKGESTVAIKLKRYIRHPVRTGIRFLREPGKIFRIWR